FFRLLGEQTAQIRFCLRTRCALIGRCSAFPIDQQLAEIDPEMWPEDLRRAVDRGAEDGLRAVEPGRHAGVMLTQAGKKERDRPLARGGRRAFGPARRVGETGDRAGAAAAARRPAWAALLRALHARWCRRCRAS